MKKGNRKYVIIIIVLIIYFIVMFCLFGVGNLKKEKEKTTILVGDDTVWNYSDQRWSNVTKVTNIKKLDWQNFNVYVDGKKLGNYSVWYDDKWYLFNDKKESVSFSGNLFAYQANYDISVLSFDSLAISDFSYVKKLLNNKKIDYDNNFTVSSITSLDIDNDSVNEDFYIVSNAFAMDFTPSKYFSLVFMVKDNKIYMLYDDVDTFDAYKGCKPYINSVVDIDDDDNYEIILTCAKYSTQTPVNMLYKFSDGAFKILISNQ